MPIDFNSEHENVEITLGEGDVGIVASSSHSPLDPDRLSLLNLGKDYGIGAPLPDISSKPDEELQNREVTILLPKTIDGLNSAWVLLNTISKLVLSLKFNLLVNQEPDLPVEGVKRCLFCTHQEKDSEGLDNLVSLVEYFGTFVCTTCVDQLLYRSSTPEEFTTLEREKEYGDILGALLEATEKRK